MNELMSVDIKTLTTGDLESRVVSSLEDAALYISELKQRKPWRVKGISQDEYWRGLLGKSKRYIDMQLAAGRIQADIKMGTIVPTPPTHESQLRPLVGLSQEDRIEAWQTAVDTAPDGKITASHVERVARAITNNDSYDIRTESSEVGRINIRSNNEWWTPEKYVDAARRVMGDIDLDPASSDEANEIVGASMFFTKDEDGLGRDWFGRVWLNPPYGGAQAEFTQKLIGCFEGGEVSEAILLVNANATDTKWFAGLWDYLLCFTDHRINFHSPLGVGDGSTHGSVFVYMGTRRDIFIQEFSSFGVVVERVK